MATMIRFTPEYADGVVVLRDGTELPLREAFDAGRLTIQNADSGLRFRCPAHPETLSYAVAYFSWDGERWQLSRFGVGANGDTLAARSFEVPDPPAPAPAEVTATIQANATTVPADTFSWGHGCDASELGLRPGQWPQRVYLATDLATGRGAMCEFDRFDDAGSAVYRGPSGQTVFLFND